MPPQLNQTSGTNVWIFHGEGGRFAGAAFTSRDMAEKWIAKHGLSGVLTLYPLDVGVYEWAVERGPTTPTRK